MQAKVSRRRQGQVPPARLPQHSQLQRSQASLLPSPSLPPRMAAATSRAAAANPVGQDSIAEAVSPTPMFAQQLPLIPPAQECVVSQLELLAQPAPAAGVGVQQPSLATEAPVLAHAPGALPGSWAQPAGAATHAPQQQSGDPSGEGPAEHAQGLSACAMASVTASLDEGMPQAAEPVSGAASDPLVEEQPVDPYAFEDAPDTPGVKTTWRRSSGATAGCAAGSKLDGGPPAAEQQAREEPLLALASLGVGAAADELGHDSGGGQPLLAEEQLDAQTQPSAAEQHEEENAEPRGQVLLMDDELDIREQLCPAREQGQQDSETDLRALAADEPPGVQEQPGLNQEQDQEEADLDAYVQAAVNQLDMLQHAGTQGPPERPGGDQQMEFYVQLCALEDERAQHEDGCAQAIAQPPCATSPHQAPHAGSEQPVEAPVALPISFGCKRCRYIKTGCSLCNPAKRKGGCAKCMWKLAGCANCKNTSARSRARRAAADSAQAPLSDAEGAPHAGPAMEAAKTHQTAAAAPPGQASKAAAAGSCSQQLAPSLQQEVSGCPSGLQQADVGRTLGTLVNELAGYSRPDPGQPQPEAAAPCPAEVASTPRRDSAAQPACAPAAPAVPASAAQGVEHWESPAGATAPSSTQAKRRRADAQCDSVERRVRSSGRVRRPPSAYWKPEPEQDAAPRQASACWKPEPEQDAALQQADGGGSAGELRQRRRSSRQRPQHELPWWERTTSSTPAADRDGSARKRRRAGEAASPPGGAAERHSTAATRDARASHAGGGDAFELPEMSPEAEGATAGGPTKAPRSGRRGEGPRNAAGRQAAAAQAAAAATAQRMARARANALAAAEAGAPDLAAAEAHAPRSTDAPSAAKTPDGAQPPCRSGDSTGHGGCSAASPAAGASLGATICTGAARAAVSGGLGGAVLGAGCQDVPQLSTGAGEQAAFDCPGVSFATPMRMTR